MNDVIMKKEKIMIPTYGISKPEKNPLFLEKRVYQGSSGKVYPLPVIEQIYDEKEEKYYNAIILENEYLQVTILPELGGRIQRALDKTNNYDFVYYNHVIKPALVGLVGPWISGGIEFNWPQHHRPSTYAPVDFEMIENADGSKTVWVSEIDQMYGTKGAAGFTLYPDKAYIEISGRVFNMTDIPQTFLWWSNPAVPVNDHTYSVFPPDVHAVMDHGKRAVSSFPIATGEYYKCDYSSGVDISRYKNVPVPTSYMAYHSDYNFIGNYDENLESGLLHVASHHFSPGKKQWTWGNGDFGRAWDRNLTDEDGPYIELMTGVFTDNQPDFTWLKPYEEKTFKQYFMPYKGVGHIKNATIDCAINIELENNEIIIKVYTTAIYDNSTIKIDFDKEILFEEKVNLSPAKFYCKKIKTNKASLVGAHISVVCGAKILVEYTEMEKELKPIPEPAKALTTPKDLRTCEELFLAGTHLEQYRHATFEPSDYYLEGLQRDDTDLRLNNAYGLLLYKRGCFDESIKYFKKAIEKQTWKSPNPYYGECYFNLGLALIKIGEKQKAYDSFYKSTWSDETQGAAFYQLAVLEMFWGNYKEALELAEKSILRNYHNIKARNVKTVAYRLLNMDNSKLIEEHKIVDNLDYVNIYEECLKNNNVNDFKNIIGGKLNNIFEMAIFYMELGRFDDSIQILNSYNELSGSKLSGTGLLPFSASRGGVSNPIQPNEKNPLIYYYTAYAYGLKNCKEEELEFLKKAQTTSSDYCFPNKLSEILILENAIEKNSDDSFAYYYLGNLFYDKKQYEKAISLWEKSAQLNDKFSIVLRNLSLAYYNKLGKKQEALELMRKAVEINTTGRVLLEYDQLLSKLNFANEYRLNNLRKNIDIVRTRDDLKVEEITLLNNIGEFDQALRLIESNKFHPWEGGEGKISSQFIYSLVELAKIQIGKGQYESSIDLLEKSLSYPENLGEGKLPNAQDNIQNYYIGICYKKMENTKKANKYFQLASEGLKEPSNMMYYNDQPADTILYQGLALEELGKETEAKSRYYALLSYGEKHIFDEVSYDYFAVSLPDTMIFEEDINIRNKIYCKYLMGLGNFGLKNKDLAKENFKIVLELCPNHQGAIRHFTL